MLNYAIVAFLVAAVGGLFMAMQIFKNRKPAVAVALLHGALGATGLGLLAWLVLTAETLATNILAGLVILLVAAVGGFYLASFHLRGVAHPKPVVVIHAIAAVTGVGALLLSLM